MWINQQEIRSSSSSRKYTVSELVTDGRPTGTWGCSCQGWKAYGHCKHLDSMGLPSARDRSTPAPRGLGKSDNSSFQDGAYQHYDPYREGYGSTAEWHRLADLLRGGKVNQIISDSEWSRIFALVDERELSKEQMESLDAWVTGKKMWITGKISHPVSTVGIIEWLETLPLRTVS